MSQERPVILEDLWSAVELAEAFGVSANTVRKWCSSEALPNVRIGKGRWVFAEDLRRFLLDRREHARQDASNNTQVAAGGDAVQSGGR